MKLHRLSMNPRTYRNLDRYRQILGILFKYGFDGVLDRMNLGSHLGAGLQMIPRSPHAQGQGLTDNERIRMAVEELGPTFVKMGQVLSTRPDLIPLDLVQELSRLQDDVPPFPTDQVKEILHQELRAPMDAFFSWFDETPLAAASIGQVHRARLTTGEEVIVKVQRPGIKQIIDADLEILCHIAVLLEKHVEEARIYQPVKIVDEFARSIDRETNYEIEAQHAERFARQFANKKSIYIPKVFGKITTKRVLTMEYVEGIKVSDVELLKISGLNCKVIASRGAELTFEQLFRHGFFHADPHPGNISILPGNVICYLDFGMMDYVDKQSMEIFADMIAGYVNRDKTAITDAAMRIAEWDEKPDRRALEGDIKGFIDRYLYQPLQDMHVGDLLTESLQILARHRLRLPPDLFFMIKAVSEVEGIGRMLDPDFDLANKVKPFIMDIQKERIRPGRFIDDILALSTHLRNLPLDLQELFRQLKLGKGRLHIEHKGLEPLVSGISRSSNRIAFSLIIASLIIGSSVITATHAGASADGMPLLGIIGFAIAAVLGLCMLVSIWRSGRL
jgi:ubiquinone biosynthesis protein